MTEMDISWTTPLQPLNLNSREVNPSSGIKRSRTELATDSMEFQKRPRTDVGGNITFDHRIASGTPMVPEFQRQDILIHPRNHCAQSVHGYMSQERSYVSPPQSFGQSSSSLCRANQFPVASVNPASHLHSNFTRSHTESIAPGYVHEVQQSGVQNFRGSAEPIDLDYGQVNLSLKQLHLQRVRRGIDACMIDHRATPYQSSFPFP